MATRKKLSLPKLPEGELTAWFVVGVLLAGLWAAVHYDPVFIYIPHGRSYQ